LNLQADRSAPFTTLDVEIAREAADELALAIQHAQLFEQVKAGRDRMERLSRRLLDVQETERRAIARELHDEIGQALTAIKIDLQSVQSSVTGPAVDQLAESIEVVDQALQQVRDLSLDLRPSLLDDLGLPAALRWYVDRQAQRAGLEAHLNVDTVRERLDPNSETVCFRVVQEAVTNAIRHAHAQRIYVELAQREAQLLLTIQDDGRGFEVTSARARAMAGTSLGLLGMEERVWLSGGEIEIESAPGKGATVRARLPFRPVSR
jgi:signal transduction histidine kinase